jgi:thiol-disulfide isomerase/thioredoxin
MERSDRGNRLAFTLIGRSLGKRARRQWLAASVPVLFMAACSSGNPEATVGSRELVLPTPSFELELLARQGTINSNELWPRGRLNLLVFWGTWCPPCVAGMPRIESLHRKFASKGLQIVAIATRDDRKAVEEFCKEHGLTVAVGFDTTGEIADRFRVSSYPSLVLLDREGRYLGMIRGELQELEQKIERWLATAKRDTP